MINRKRFAFVYFSVVLMITAYLIYELLESARGEKITAIIGSTLPDLILYDLDGTPFKLHGSEHPVLMVFFDSTCENCVYETKLIKENISVIGDTFVFMLSSEALAAIRQFSEQSGLKGYSNIKFARISANDQQQLFGQLSYPHILIYGADKKLVRKYQGVIEPPELLQCLKTK